MDVLTDVMQTVRVRSNLYGRAEFTAPWGIEVPGEAGHAGFFAISRGSCWFAMDKTDPIPLAGGDFIFIPHGDSYTLRDALSSPVTPVCDITRTDELGPVCILGGGGAPTSAIWGCFEFEDGGRNPLLESLPPMIHLTPEVGTNVRWLQSTLQFVASEAASGLPGAETVANRLTDILFVHAIRAFIAGCAAQGCRASGWLRALADPKIGEALKLIHESPQERWTVEKLAESVSMSRSAFAAQFSEMVGEPPLRYVTAWRMKKASHMLLNGQPIRAAAHAVGYDTDAAFGKAFKNYAGTTPGEFRRQQQQRSTIAAEEECQAPPMEESAATSHRAARAPVRRAAAPGGHSRRASG